MKTYGLDISKHNGTLDFKAIKDAGHSFVIIRVGYGTSGTIDPKFEEYYKGAKKAGLHIGGYWYSYALTAADGTKEAQKCYDAIKCKTFDYPVYIDMEDADGYKRKHGMPSNATLCAICNNFCSYMESKGVYTGIYANKDWFSNKLKNVSNKYDKWFAQYGTNNGKQQQEYNGKYPIHQYTSLYKLNGKPFDKNACYVDYPTKIAGENAETEVEKPAEKPAQTLKYSADVKEWQHAYNVGFDVAGTENALAEDGYFGPLSEAFAKAHLVYQNVKGCPTAVKWVQSKVGASVDGVFGSATKEAVEKYQKAHGLTVDGIVGVATIKSILKQ